MDLESLNFTELRDAEIVARMRKCNYEKFKTLVRMHLSFELDLNTDEFDLPCHEIVYEDKGKLKKWNRLSKKHKHGGVMAAALATGSAGCASVGVGHKSGHNVNGNCDDGSPIEGLHQQIDAGFLFHLQELKEFLMLEKNLQQEGIFRKTGSASRQNDLRAQIQNDKPLELETSGYSAHDCATVFKGYLADLPEPLLTDAHYPAHLQIAPLCLGINHHLEQDKSTTTTTNNAERVKKELHVLNSIQLLLLLLPDENRQLLQNIIDMLHAVAQQHEFNKMGPENLATLFAPHLICPRNLPPEALHYLAKKMSSIIAYMIIRGQDIFSVPAKLATDIRAYFLERKRKKTMSPEMTLDDSISDISTVNTVYTFVDREKTAAAHNTNNTDTELAQLYAHIQSLPESSKKRRLIKQFNKQNGQGKTSLCISREYLLTRSVLTAPPEDTSFTSHSDDFDSSHEIEEIDENQLSSSLLYCLDGNRPEITNDSNTTTTENFEDNDDDTENTTHTNEDTNTATLALLKTVTAVSSSSSGSNSSNSSSATSGSSSSSSDSSNSASSNSSNSCHTPHIPLITTNRLANNPFVILNNARKRAATQDLEKISSTLFNSHAQSPNPTTTTTAHTSYHTGLAAKQLNSPTSSKPKINCNFATNSNSSSNKENCEHNENYVVSKKMLISEYPGETSF
ncbi:rho GTPase-activating protein gacGG [Lucilia cuprina]|uniref:rho GTPase-activating protein gacGG n=1 Tax=Lucilia cuprina TaxID=7375 RepID=UPI001F05F023|nr:rho GTPase-activating protein gacGG [Lucilia cuprina]